MVNPEAESVEQKLQPEQMTPEARVERMRTLLGTMDDNELSDVDELAEFLDLYRAHEVEGMDEITLWEGLDVPEHGIIFGDTTYETIVEAYDGLGGTPRENLPSGTPAIPNELEKSLGRAYIAVTTASESLRPREGEFREPAEIVSTASEFSATVVEMGYSKHTATRTWNMLAGRFLKRVQPEQYSHYDAEDHSAFPDDLFVKYPSSDYSLPHTRYQTLGIVNGLRLESLESMLARIESRGGDTDAVHDVLGSRIGPKTHQLLKDFAKAKREEANAAE